MRQKLLILWPLLLLAGCGYKSEMTRLPTTDPDVRSTVSKEQQQQARAAERQSVQKGLAIIPETRPIRVDELSVKLEVRTDDPFNLPPDGSKGERPIPFPGDPAPKPTPSSNQPKLKD